MFSFASATKSPLPCSLRDSWLLVLLPATRPSTNSSFVKAFDPLLAPHSVNPLAVGSITPGIATIKQLAAQLDQWRGMLPDYLNWHDSSQSGHFSERDQGLYEQSLFPPSVQSHGDLMFASDLDVPPAGYAADIQTANLRTRYYYIKYLVHRPFVFKALHYPEHMVSIR